jgi:hypothetical protein
MAYSHIRLRPERNAQIEAVVPHCPRCRVPMQLAEISRHPQFLSVEVVSFACHCGAMDKRPATHIFID